jgi:hypothetical protein
MRPTTALGAAALSLVLASSAARAQQPMLLEPVPVANVPATPIADSPPVVIATPPAPEDVHPPGAADAKETKDARADCKPPAVVTPEFLGDQAPIGSLLLLPRGPFDGHGAMLVPSARYFKISDDDSPRPQNRSYFSFNYFYNLDNEINRLAGGNILHTRIHREIWGWEWALPDGSASVGLRLPLNTYNATHTIANLDGTSTDIGDLTVIFKDVLWENRDTGGLLSAGLAVTPPTGPGSFAGSNEIKVFHNTVLQPYCGWIWAHEQFYLQGFTAVDAPTDLNDVVMLSNSVAAGYFLYQKRHGEGVSAVVPTLEVHVNTPLNHRGILRLTDPAGTPDMIDLTAGLHLEYQDKSSMGVAFAVPVSGPRMFDFEILAQFRWRY